MELRHAEPRPPPRRISKPPRLSAESSALLLAALAIGAVSPPNRLQGKPGEVVRRSIEHAGGWDAWEQKRTVQFRKTTTRYLPDGKVERRRVQVHRYILRPEMRARIDWEENSKRYTLINDGRQAWKLVDGREATTQTDINEARNATFGSHYVFGMPFKLTDPGAILEHSGRGRLGGGNVDRVRVDYEKGAGDAGGMHAWTYLFDARTGRLVANHLQYEADKYDYTEYLDEKPTSGLLLPMRRLGYNANPKGKRGPRTTEILYEDVRWNEDLPPALFARSR